MNCLHLDDRVVLDYGRALGSPGAYQDLIERGTVTGFERSRNDHRERIRVRFDNGDSTLHSYHVLFNETEYPTWDS